MRPLALALAIALLLPLAQAADVVTFRYVAGAAKQPVSVGGVCTSASLQNASDPREHLPLVVGGVCRLPLAGATTMDIAVHDDLAGAMPFRWLHEFCAPGGAAVGSASAAIPLGCTNVTVYVDRLGSTGTLSVARS